MSSYPESDGIVTLPVPEQPAEATDGHVAEVAVAPEPAPEAPAIQSSFASEGVGRRARPAWIVPAAIASIGVIVAATLGFFLYSTIQQRNAMHQQLVATKTTLASTQGQLTAAQADAASKKVTADYVAAYVTDEGKVLTDYEATVNCSGYSECRTSAQQFMTDMEAFQADRKAAKVPFAAESSDSSLGDALSAAIAADQELISGMDNNDVSKITDGGTKVDAAMLNLAKAESALGTELK
jgi:hypothetical protein